MNKDVIESRWMFLLLLWARQTRARPRSSSHRLAAADGAAAAAAAISVLWVRRAMSCMPRLSVTQQVSLYIH